jgi:hypothetical protein
MSGPTTYNGGIAIGGANNQVTGAGGDINIYAPLAAAGPVIAIRDADLEAVMMQLAKLRASMHLAQTADAEQIGNEVAALSNEVGKTKRVDQSRASALLSKLKGGAEVTKSVAEAAGALSKLFGLS